MKIVVIGGTGTVGSQLVSELMMRGTSIRILARDPEKYRHKHSSSIEWFQGALEAPERELLLREPRSFEDFVAETVAKWRNAAEQYYK